jgi:hypothetical protein
MGTLHITRPRIDRASIQNTQSPHLGREMSIPNLSRRGGGWSHRNIFFLYQRPYVLRRHLCEDDALNDGSPAYHGEVWLLPSHRVWGMRRGTIQNLQSPHLGREMPIPNLSRGGGVAGGNRREPQSHRGGNLSVLVKIIATGYNGWFIKKEKFARALT